MDSTYRLERKRKRRSHSANESFSDSKFSSGKRNTWKKGRRVEKKRRVTISESATKIILDESQVVSELDVFQIKMGCTLG